MRLRHRNQMWIGHRVPPAGTVTPPVDPCVANLANDQIAYWDCDAIPNADDIAGRVMTAPGGFTIVPGKIGNAWRIDGSPGPTMTAPDDAPLRLVGTNFTVRFWVHFLELDQVFPNDIITKFSGFTGWGMTISSASILLFKLGNGSTLFSINGPLVEYAQWYHVVVVYSLAPVPQVQFYMNSVLQATVVSSQFTVASNTDVLAVGANPAGGTNGANILFDEFGLWGFPFTQCEVDADWNSGEGRTHPFV